MEEKEIKIVFEGVDDYYKLNKFRVDCEGLNSGYGYSIADALANFDERNEVIR